MGTTLGGIEVVDEVEEEEADASDCEGGETVLGWGEAGDAVKVSEMVWGGTKAVGDTEFVESEITRLGKEVMQGTGE